MTKHYKIGDKFETLQEAHDFVKEYKGCVSFGLGSTMGIAGGNGFPYVYRSGRENPTVFLIGPYVITSLGTAPTAPEKPTFEAAWKALKASKRIRVASVKYPFENCTYGATAPIDVSDMNGLLAIYNAVKAACECDDFIDDMRILARGKLSVNNIAANFINIITARDERLSALEAENQKLKSENGRLAKEAKHWKANHDEHIKQKYELKKFYRRVNGVEDGTRRIAALETENSILRKALRFYADEFHWARTGWMHKDTGEPCYEFNQPCDGGKLARQALAATEEAE